VSVGLIGLLREILESKHGPWRSLKLNIYRSYESRWWRDLRKMCGGAIEG